MVGDWLVVAAGTNTSLVGDWLVVAAGTNTSRFQHAGRADGPADLGALVPAQPQRPAGPGRRLGGHRPLPRRGPPRPQRRGRGRLPVRAGRVARVGGGPGGKFLVWPAKKQGGKDRKQTPATTNYCSHCEAHVHGRNEADCPDCWVHHLRNEVPGMRMSGNLPGTIELFNFFRAKGRGPEQTNRC